MGITFKAKTSFDKAILQGIAAAMNCPSVTVGVPNIEKYPNGTLVSKVAAIHEYGSSRHPPRSFVRSTDLINRDKWRAQVAADLMNVRSDADMRKLWRRLGKKIVGQMQDKITDLGLVRTGTLRGSLRYRMSGGDWES